MKCKFKPLSLAIVAILLTNVHSKAQNTSPWPSSGNIGIGTTTPGANLEINSFGTGTPDISLLINTGFIDANGYNQESVKIINREREDADISTNDVLSVWREWVPAGGGIPYLETNPYFRINHMGSVDFGQRVTANSDFIVEGLSLLHNTQITGGLNVDLNIIANDLEIHNNATIDNDLTVNNNLKINSLSTGSNKMAVLSASGDFSAWDLPSLDLSGTTLSLKSGTTTLNSVTLPTSGGDDLGSHTATMDLNMSNNDINNAASINVSNVNVSGLINMNNHSISDIYSMYGNGAALYFNSGSIALTNQLYIGNNLTSSYTLYVSGSAYCTSTWQTSDQRFKKNITEVNNISNDLFKLHPYSYNLDVEGFPERHFDDRKTYGFLAQEVGKIFPNLVKKDIDGYLAINYTEFVPLLLQALKEENAQIEEQQTQINQLTEQLAVLTEKVNAIAQTPTGTPGTSTQSIKSVLEQNVPNPFNAETRIAYNIVEKYSKAFIGIYDLSGKEVKQIPLNTAKGEVVLPANNLTPGMYVYSLLVDNQLIDSKKMVIME